MKLADLARTNRQPSASPAAIFAGQYIEPAVRVCPPSFRPS